MTCDDYYYSKYSALVIHNDSFSPISPLKQHNEYEVGKRMSTKGLLN